jgi:hypothetical protein
VSASIGGLIQVQRAVPLSRRQEHNEVAGFMYAVLGVAYAVHAVLLGLMVVAVWQDYEVAEASAAKEANAVSTVF